MSYTIGGGGAPAGATTTDSYALDKPYEVYWPLTQEQVEQINQMLDTLFKYVTRAKTDVDAVKADISSIGVKVALRTLTHGELTSCNTSPITLVSAPGSKLFVMPIAYSMEKALDTAYAENPSFQLRFRGDTTQLTPIITPLLNAIADRWHGCVADPAGAWVTTTSPINKDLVLFSSADLTLGASTNLLRVKVAYYLVETIN